MDVQWFKKRQRAAGVTADEIGDALGRDRSIVSRIYAERQTMTLQQAQIFASKLNVPIADVLEHAGLADARTAQQVQPAQAGSDATPWNAATGSVADREMMSFLGGGRPGLDVWRVSNRAMVLDGYIEGDFILVDHNVTTSTAAGRTVIAQVYDWQSGTAATLLRRYDPPVLTSASADPEDRKVHVVDDKNVAIKGVVVASWRGGVRQ